MLYIRGSTAFSSCNSFSSIFDCSAQATGIHKSLESEQGDLVYMRLLNEFIVTNVSGIVSAGWSHLPFYLAGIKSRFIKPIDAQLFRFWICCPS